MSFEQIVFYIFSAMLVSAGVLVITLRNPVHAVLSLVLAFFSSAGLEQVAAPPPAAADVDNTEQLGLAMFTNFVLPLEVASVILLVAIIAAIALTLRSSRQTKAPKPELQVRVRREDRVRLIKMDAEKGA